MRTCVLKTIQEIVERAVCLLALCDRCALEEEINDGVWHSWDERVQQRENIWEWMEKHGYVSALTEEERSVLFMPVGKLGIPASNNIELCCQAIQPFLWVVGLWPELSPHDQAVLTDFHDTLNIRRNHSKEVLMEKLELKDEDTIRFATEVSMLWHWRCVEGKRARGFKKKGAAQLILRTFGQDYEKYLPHIPFNEKKPRDFLVCGKPFCKADDKIIAEVSAIAYWRHKAFEWILSEEDWDNVSADT